MNIKKFTLEKLFNGVRAFKRIGFELRRSMFVNLEQTQNPHTLFIGCSDSRVVPNLITIADPGELFIVRNIANMIPPYDFDGDSDIATSSTIEYAVNVLNVDNIVVCGHSNCGGCRAIFDSDESMKSLPKVKKWIELAKPIKDRVDREIAKSPKAAKKRDEMTAQYNVLEQINHLLTFPYVKERYEKGELNILGWYYVIETGEIYNYSKETKKFEKID